ncbi:MAG TPA: adenylate/guanylate cyclase domain-containing protein [Nitrospira sp.]|nr:adenylate/guanylate cyclase domain-containing protein [Nitrospira sp.]
MSGEHEDYLKGHRREITVVFVDLRGFTAFVEKSEPEDVITMLREYQTAVGHLVSEYGQEHVLTEPVGDLTLKGFHKPVMTYNVTGLAGKGPA